MRWFAAPILFFTFNALAQYSGPAVESCRAYAAGEVRKDGITDSTVIIDNNSALDIERYTRKAGSQFVSSLLRGNGAIVHSQAAPVEMSFVCLLADEKRAIFFYWIPRHDAPVLAQCRRTKAAAKCLDGLLLVAEQDLTQIYSRHYIDSRDVDAKAKNENASNAFRRSADAFKAYRDAECGRRSGAEAQKACMVELTRRRARELL